MKDTRICFIGCGNMGRSLIGGILANDYPAELLCGVDPDPGQCQQIRALFGIQVYETPQPALDNVDIVVLAVKPQAMKNAVELVTDNLTNQPLIISIAAGIRVASITKWLKLSLPVIRVMPNTPSLIQAGAAALFANDKTNDEQKEMAESIMRSVGTAVWLDQETSMDTVTALSGSGPAYFFLLMEILEKAAIDMGLQQTQARLLTLETALGAAKMAIESDHDAASLRQQVTSPGGTTEQALRILTEGNIDQLFHRALAAARQRSVELADTFGGES